MIHLKIITKCLLLIIFCCLDQNIFLIFWWVCSSLSYEASITLLIKLLKKQKQTWCPCNYQSDMGIVKLWASWMWSCVYSGGWYTCDVWKESSYWGWKSGFIFYRLMVYLTMIPVADADIFDRKCRLESSLTKSWSAIKIGVPARVLLSDHIWLKIQLSQMN